MFIVLSTLPCFLNNFLKDFKDISSLLPKIVMIRFFWNLESINYFEFIIHIDKNSFLFSNLIFISIIVFIDLCAFDQFFDNFLVLYFILYINVHISINFVSSKLNNFKKLMLLIKMKLVKRFYSSVPSQLPHQDI